MKCPEIIKNATEEDFVTRIKTKNTQPKKYYISSSGKKRYSENFRGNVRSTLRPYHNTPSNDIYYKMRHRGAGRKNQTLIGDDSFKNIPKILNKNVTHKDMVNRKMNDDLFKRQIAKKPGRLTGGLVGGIGSAATIGMSIAKKNPRYLIGLLPSLGAGLIAGGVRQGRHNQKTINTYLNKLIPGDKNIVGKTFKQRAAKVSQDAYKAHRLTARNTHVIVV